MRHSYGFFRRVWVAIKYIFRSSPCGYGHWNETIVEPSQAQEMIDICEDFIKRRKEIIKH
jgi:hypothetical protein